MRKLLPLLIFSASAFAGSSYDWQTGTQYQWNDYGDSTNVRGYNYNTGSSWNTTIEPSGSMRGMDSQGNYWNYNDDTGTYINYGTGEIRYDWE